jgi:hypothetical protein
MEEAVSPITIAIIYGVATFLIGFIGVVIYQSFMAQRRKKAKPTSLFTPPTGTYSGLFRAYVTMGDENTCERCGDIHATPADAIRTHKIRYVYFMKAGQKYEASIEQDLINSLRLLT